MSEEYSDGIDNNGYVLRYEKTQNRDITETIERFNRAVKFRDSANDVIELVSKVLKNDTIETLNGVWRSAHDTHEDPNALSVAVDIVPPVLKRVEKGNGTVQSPRGNQPFYYIFNLKVSAKFLPKDDDPMKDDEAWYGKWFIDNVSNRFSRRILEKTRDSLSTKFNNIFDFPTLASDKTNQNATTFEPVEGRINVTVSPVLKFNRNNDEIGLSSRFDSTAEMKDVLVSRISLALERVLHS